MTSQIDSLRNAIVAKIKVLKTASATFSTKYEGEDIPEKKFNEYGNQPLPKLKEEHGVKTAFDVNETTADEVEKFALEWIEKTFPNDFTQDVMGDIKIVLADIKTQASQIQTIPTFGPEGDEWTGLGGGRHNKASGSNYNYGKVLENDKNNYTKYVAEETADIADKYITNNMTGENMKKQVNTIKSFTDWLQASDYVKKKEGAQSSWYTRLYKPNKHKITLAQQDIAEFLQQTIPL